LHFTNKLQPIVDVLQQQTYPLPDKAVWNTWLWFTSFTQIILV